MPIGSLPNPHAVRGLLKGGKRLLYYCTTVLQRTLASSNACNRDNNIINKSGVMYFHTSLYVPTTGCIFFSRTLQTHDHRKHKHKHITISRVRFGWVVRVQQSLYFSFSLSPSPSPSFSFFLLLSLSLSLSFFFLFSFSGCFFSFKK